MLTWIPSFGTNPVCPLSILLLKYSYSLGKNLSSRNLYKGDSTMIGLKSDSSGISGHTLFSGTSLASVTSFSSSIAYGVHMSLSKDPLLVGSIYLRKLSDHPSKVRPLLWAMEFYIQLSSNFLIKNSKQKKNN